MRTPSRTVLLLIALCFVWAAVAASAADISCTQCGMPVDMDSKFTAKVARDGATLFFCDVGDLLTWLNRNKTGTGGAQVKDYPSGAWIDATKAFYVLAAKKFSTPMNWGIAAFQDKNRAAASGSIMDYEAALKAVK
jgi:nitrous oxide reductase accessory protein NosL